MSTTKQVIVVRTDLGMRKGKLAAQVAHASMKVLLDRGTGGYTWRVGDRNLEFGIYDDPRNPGDSSFLIPMTDDIWDWVGGIFTKIVVGVESEQDLQAIHQAAQAAGLPTALIQDSGLTEFHGVPTLTCVAVGPAKSSQIDAITGHLKLL